MRSQLKRTAAGIMIVLLLTAAFHTTVFAADKTHKIDQLGMRIALPADLSVITRSTEKSDPAYAALGYTYAAAQKEMEESDIYLKAVPKDASFEADVYMVQNEHSRDVYNFKLLTEKQLDAVKKELEADQSSRNCTVSETDDAVFFNLATEYEIPAQGNAKATKIYSVMSYTVVNGMQISFSLRSIGKPITVAQQGVFHTAASSIAFEEILQKPLEVDMLGIIITAAVTLAVLVAAASVIIILRGRKKRRKTLLLQERKHENNASSPLSGFCDELEKDGLLGTAKVKEHPVKQDQAVFPNQPVRVTVKVPVTQGEDDGIRAVDETKEKRQVITHEDEAGSVELTRSNNEDYDEAAAEESIPHSRKLRIFVGGAGSKIKNSVSSIGDLLKSRQEAETMQKQQEEPLDDYDPLKDDTYAGTNEIAPEPLPEDFEKDIIQAQPEKEAAPQKEEEAAAELQENGNPVKEEKMKKRPVNSKARESFVQAAGADEVLKSFEEDNYWDRYR